MNLYPLIAKRYSVRSYEEVPNPKVWKRLQEKLKTRWNPPVGTCALELVSHKEATRKCLVGCLGSYGLIANPQAMIVVSCEKGTENKVAAGFCGEYALLTATSFGLGSCWIGGMFSAKSVAAASTGLPKNHEIQAIITLGGTKEKADRSLKQQLFKTLSHNRGKKKALEDLLAPGELAALPLFARKGIEAVQMAPSALNKQPYVFSLAGEQLLLKATTKEGYAPLDLGIALAHFSIAAAHYSNPHNFLPVKGNPLAFEFPLAKPTYP